MNTRVLAKAGTPVRGNVPAPSRIHLILTPLQSRRWYSQSNAKVPRSLPIQMRTKWVLDVF